MLDRIPIKVSDKQLCIVITSTIAYFLYGLTISTVQKAIVSSKEITPQLMATEVWLPSVVLLLVTLTWQFIKEFMIKYYTVIELIETAISILMTLIICLHWSPVIYFLTRLVLDGVVSTFLGETAQNFKDYMFTSGKERTRCRQEFTFYKGAALILAGFIAQLIIISPESAIVLMVLGDCIRTGGAIYTFKIQHKDLTNKIIKDNKDNLI